MSISAEGLGKAYPLRRGRWARLGEWLGLLPPARRWVLRGLTFRVAPGEAVGIIGMNGAGKSTLLKLLSGVSFPTEGHVAVEGEVATLLELGMGFHPDFTGRQNAYLAGRMQGRTTAEINATIGAIEAFAEVGEYFDWPMRTYSSGMYVRVAFSVATAFRPQVLIVDEALAVGDLYFQHKSFARIREFVALGTTLLFVSHDPTAVKSLCDRAILLGDGRMLKSGRPDEVLDFYNALIAEREQTHALEQQAESFTGRSGTGEARIASATVLSADGAPRETFRVGEPARVRVSYLAQEVLPDLTLGLLIKDRTGYDIYGTNTCHLGNLPALGDSPQQARTVEFAIAALNLGPGSYSITLALHSSADHLENNYDWWERAAMFQVVPGGEAKFIGAAALTVSAGMRDDVPSQQSGH